MGKLKQIKEILKKVKSGVMKIRQIDPKILKEVLAQQLKQKILVPIINFGITIGAKVVLACLIIGVILLCFAGLFQLFKAYAEFFQGFWDGMQYMFTGTRAYVNSDDIEEVRGKIESMGVEFDEIGYIGAIKLIGGVKDWDEYKSKFNNIEDDIEDDFEEIDVKQEAIAEKQKEYDELQKNGAAQSQLDSKKGEINAKEKELAKFQDEYIEFYIRRYIEAQEQTGASLNVLTFSDNNGAIKIKHTSRANASTSFWDKFKEWFTGSFEVENRGGQFFTIFGTGSNKKEIDITKYVNNMYMPWQYPFTFHNETLSPDIGYLVANLSKYHYLSLVVDVDEILRVQMKVDDDGNCSASTIEFISGPSLKYLNSADEEKEIFREPMVLLEEITTWSTHYKYDNVYKGIFSETQGGDLEYEWHRDDTTKSKFSDSSKQKVINDIEVTEDGDILYKGESVKSHFKYLGRSTVKEEPIYYCRITMEGDQNKDEIEAGNEKNADGYDEMTKILLPYPEFDADGNLTNETLLPRYYIANAAGKDESGKYTKEPATLNVKTNAEAIIQSVDEIYTDEKIKEEVLAGDDNAMSVDEFNEMKENTKPFQPNMQIKMVADIVNFFADAGAADMANYGLVGETGLYESMEVMWFLDADAADVDIHGSGSTAVLEVAPGTTVFSPATGEVTDVIDEGEGKKTIHVTKYGTNEETGEKLPVLTVIITGVEGSSISKGQKVTAGSTNIGKVSSTGEITYQHIDGSGIPVNAREEVDKLITIETMQFTMPLPSNYTRISSWFGPRRPPVSGASSNHGGIDLPAPTGTPIYAIADGVAGSGYDSGGYGNWVWIDHAGGYRSEYGHMSSIYKRGGEVKKGELIGFVGSTGASSGPHLHLTIKLNGTKINPLEDAGLNVFYGSTQSNY